MHSFVAAAATLLFARSALSQINPDDVSSGDRDQWCVSQITQCPLICTQVNDGSAATTSNDCDADTLSWTCVCDDGQTPNVTQYTQTIPYFICTEVNNQCVDNCSGDSACQSSCREDNPCAAEDPPKGDDKDDEDDEDNEDDSNDNEDDDASPTETETSSPDSTDPADFTGLGGTPEPTADEEVGGDGETDAAFSLNIGQSYGLAILTTGFFAGFALIL